VKEGILWLVEKRLLAVGNTHVEETLPVWA
jgi:hypothetical protein